MIFSSVGCICPKCTFGDFLNCQVYKHELSMSRIGKSDDRRSTRSTKNKEIVVVDQDENDFNKCAGEWDQEMHISNDLDDLDEINLNDSFPSQPKKMKLSQHSFGIPSSPIQIGEDDPEYWERLTEFKNLLDLEFQEFRQSEQFQNFCDPSVTLENIDVSELEQIWIDINSEHDKETDFLIGQTSHYPIRRSSLQRCKGTVWFDNAMINLGFNLLQYRLSRFNNMKIVAM